MVTYYPLGTLLRASCCARCLRLRIYTLVGNIFRQEIRKHLSEVMVAPQFVLTAPCLLTLPVISHSLPQRILKIIYVHMRLYVSSKYIT